MPSLRLPPLPSRGSPPSALEDPDVWEKVLQGVAMLAYGMLRCALGPLECAIEAAGSIYVTHPASTVQCLTSIRSAAIQSPKFHL